MRKCDGREHGVERSELFVPLVEVEPGFEDPSVHNEERRKTLGVAPC